MIRAEQEKKKVLSGICQFSVRRAPEISHHCSTLQQASTKNQKSSAQPQHNGQERPLTQDVNCRSPDCHQQKKENVSTANPSGAGCRRKYLLSNMNFARAQTQALKMRKKLNYGSLERKAPKEASAAGTSLSRTDQELARKIEQMEQSRYEVGSSTLLEDSFVITGNQEKKFVLPKQLCPLVRIPEVQANLSFFQSRAVPPFQDYI